MRLRICRVLSLLCIAAAGCSGALSPEAAKWLRDANDAYARGDDATAIGESTKFLQLHAGRQEAGEAYYIRGLANCRRGNATPARQDLAAAVRATRRKDLTAMAEAKLGDMAYRSGQWPRAEQHYRRALDAGAPDAPPADEATYRLGALLQREGRWRDADAQFDRLLHFFPDSPLARLATDRVRAQRWSIQAAALAKASAANETQATLRRAGMPSRVDLALRGDRMLRLVRVGSYQSYDAALADLAKVRKFFADAYIAPAR